MANTYRLKVDLKLKKTGTVPLFVQYDDARLEFKLYDGGKLFDLTNYGSVEFTHKKPSGKVVVADGAIELDEKGDKVVTYDYYGSEMGELGFTLVSFSLFDDVNNKISMQPFKIEVVTDLRDSVMDRANPEIGKFQEFQADLQIVKDDMIAKTEGTLLATEEALTAATNAQANADQWKYDSAFSMEKAYKKNNTVTYNGEGYIAKKDVTGIAPTGLISDVNWGLIARKGADGTGTVVRHKDKFTATAGQTEFTLSKTYDQNQNRIDVTVGNVPQFSPVNFIESAANKIRFTEGLSAGTEVIVSYFSQAQPMASDLETKVNNYGVIVNDQVLTINDHKARIKTLEDTPIKQAKMGLDTVASATGKAVRWDEFSNKHNNDGSFKANAINTADIGLTAASSATGKPIRWDEFSSKHNNDGTFKTGAVGNADIADTAINNAKVANNAAIVASKLAIQKMFKKSNTVALNPTKNTYGANSEVIPPAGYVALVPLGISFVFSGTFAAETLDIEVTATFADLTTSSWSKIINNTSTFSFIPMEMLELVKDGTYITKISARSRSSIDASAVDISFRPYGFYL